MSNRSGKTLAAYAKAGVDTEVGNRFVQKIKANPCFLRTDQEKVIGGLGCYGGVFDMEKAGYTDPLLVASSDGVGTKILLAREPWAWRAVGMDLVAMCVNDLIVKGAEPLFFLDYMARSRLDIEWGMATMEGMSEACREAGCAIIGGETAQMPGLYEGDRYDLAGFAVGAVERGALLPSGKARAGDKVLGLGSVGLHANGFSLVRKIMEKEGVDLKTPFPSKKGRSFGEMLLTPTRLYVRPLLSLLRRGGGDHGVRGLAHITGGGLVENIPRGLGAEGLAVEIEADALPMGEPFDWLRERGGLSDADMFETFNCGIGMALIVDPARADDIGGFLEDKGERVIALGHVREARGEDSGTCLVKKGI